MNGCKKALNNQLGEDKMLDQFEPQQLQQEGTVELPAPSGASSIALESLTIAQCASVADQIRQNLTQGLPTLLDLSQCQEADSAGIQLLVALQSDPATSLSVHWTKPSVTLSMKADRLGVQSWVNAGVLEQ
jgi:ABC-type transporter Mla MlaB component